MKYNRGIKKIIKNSLNKFIILFLASFIWKFWNLIISSFKFCIFTYLINMSRASYVVTFIFLLPKKIYICHGKWDTWRCFSLISNMLINHILICFLRWTFLLGHYSPNSKRNLFVCRKLKILSHMILYLELFHLVD